MSNTAILVFHGGTPRWRIHTGLYKFWQNISTDIWRLGRRAGLQFGELSPLVILYNIITSQLFPLDGFRFIFLLRDSAYQQFFWRGEKIKIVLRANNLFFFLFAAANNLFGGLHTIYFSFFRLQIIHFSVNGSANNLFQNFPFPHQKMVCPLYTCI